ncbi:CBS domain-containing protein [Candidatus Bathyarchaeota archaeon]|nr:CBS domain-containing protein [Candidatus Bathyarchaeota archaeon]
MLPSLKEIELKRKSLGLNQKQLAKLAGVSQSFIAKIESGKINPSYEKTKTIFDVLESVERRREIKIEQIMHKEVVGVNKKDSVVKVARLMSETGYSQLPVFNEEKKVVGSVTEKTILDQIVRAKDPKELSNLSVEEIMEGAFPTIDEKSPVETASFLLQYSPAVLVVRKGEVAGIVTKADLLKTIH